MGEIVWTAVGTRDLHESAQVKKVGNKYLIMIERTNWSYQTQRKVTQLSQWFK